MKNFILKLSITAIVASMGLSLTAVYASSQQPSGLQDVPGYYIVSEKSATGPWVNTNSDLCQCSVSKKY